MEYSMPKKDKKDVLDESNIVETLGMIKNLIGEDFEVEIETEVDLIKFINNPDLFLNDEQIVDSIRKLKEVIIEMSDFYYA